MEEVSSDMQEWRNVHCDLRNIDCMDLMREFEDKHFDLAIVDPPYGIKDLLITGGETNKKCKLQKGLEAWDIRPTQAYFLELFRVSKDQIIWGGNYFPEYLRHSRGWIFWDKMIPDNFKRAKGELAFTSFNRNLEKVTMSYDGRSTPGRNYIKRHPTEKPVNLYGWLLRNYAEPGFKILDTHFGVGNIAIACLKMGLDFVGSEINPEYFNLARERIMRETAQLSNVNRRVCMGRIIGQNVSFD